MPSVYFFPEIKAWYVIVIQCIIYIIIYNFIDILTNIIIAIGFVIRKKNNKVLSYLVL